MGLQHKKTKKYKKIEFQYHKCIQGIYHVYTMYILAHGIYMVYMVYTWYIPCIIFIGVPDEDSEDSGIRISIPSLYY
jgi:hypothetical protein